MTDEGLKGAWSAASSSGPAFALDQLKQFDRAIQQQARGRADMMFLAPPPRGTSQRQRRRRLVTLRNGMRLELPDGMHPTVFMLSSADEQVRMLAAHLNPEPMRLIITDDVTIFDDIGTLPEGVYGGIPLFTSLRVPPNAVFVVQQPANLPRWRV